jgi:hypothetical protein
MNNMYFAMATGSLVRTRINTWIHSLIGVFMYVNGCS